MQDCREFLIGTCFHCGATVLLSACEQMKLAELIVKANTFSYNLSITVKHLLTLEQLPTGEITKVLLLDVLEFHCEYNEMWLSPSQSLRNSIDSYHYKKQFPCSYDCRMII